MSFVLRRLRVTDSAACAELEQVLFAGDNPWSRDVLAVEIAQPHTHYLGIFQEDHLDDELRIETFDTGKLSDEETLVAYGGIAMLGPKEDPEFEIHTIGVDPRFQRRGFARALMEQFIQTADFLGGPMFLEVRTDNEPAIKLYESFGFDILATRKNYYKPSGADAYTMKRGVAGKQELGT